MQVYCKVGITSVYTWKDVVFNNTVRSFRPHTVLPIGSIVGVIYVLWGNIHKARAAAPRDATVRHHVLCIGPGKRVSYLRLHPRSPPAGVKTLEPGESFNHELGHYP